MDRRKKPGGITVGDLRDAMAAAHAPEPVKRSGMYWKIRKQLEWEHRKKVMDGQARARAEGKHVGRPPKTALGANIAEMRAGGMTWKEISAKTHMSMTTACRRYRRYLTSKGLSDWTY